MIIWNHTLKVKYENLLVLAEIARVQCISTASYEGAFSIKNYLKTKQRTRMLIKNLESVLQIALEVLIDNCYEIISEAIGIFLKTPNLGIYFVTLNSIYVELLVVSKKIIICYDLCMKYKLLCWWLFVLT